uniref:F-box associated domain-containing protein n=1 Tax=Oryza meridionalis TaxID=40149 RepID=A0A0E0FER9_9ORYZ
MGTMADVSLTRVPYYCKTHSVYLRGALYMHCQNDCIIKITPADHKYRVIKLPGDFASNRNASDPFLGKSKDRVHYALVTRLSRLQIWFLNETSSSSSYDDNEWVLKHYVDLGSIIQSYPCKHGRQQWICHNADTKQDKTRELPAVNDMEEFEWAIDKDFDDDVDNISGASESIHHNGQRVSAVLEFHPFRDIVFLYDTKIRVVAYDYSKAKDQDLRMMFLYHNTDKVLFRLQSLMVMKGMIFSEIFPSFISDSVSAHGVTAVPTTLPTFTTRPEHRDTMCGATARTIRSCPRKLTSMACCTAGLAVQVELGERARAPDVGVVQQHVHAQGRS